MIYAEQLSRMYDAHMAVENLSFHVQRGEVMGLLGPNGAGKSTTMKMLACFLPPSSGNATIAGLDIADDLAVRRHVGYLPEHAPSYVDLTVQGHLQFIGRMHGLPPGTLADRIKDMAGACGLEHVLMRRIDELSKGYRQRVGLAASMLHDPDCLILDEPTTGLDPNQVIEIRHLIRRLGKEKTVLLSSHVLSEVEAVCDRMMIIDAGKLQVIGTREELVHKAQGGLILHVRLCGDAEAVMQYVQKSLPDTVSEITSTHGDETQLVFKHVDAKAAVAAQVFHGAVAHAAVLLEMKAEETSLEDVFCKITGGHISC